MGGGIAAVARVEGGEKEVRREKEDKSEGGIGGGQPFG